ELIDSLAPFAPVCLTLRRLMPHILSLRTSLERKAPESLTPAGSGFVHRNISRAAAEVALDQVWRGRTRRGFGCDSLKFCRCGVESETDESQQGFAPLRWPSKYPLPLWERVRSRGERG